MIRSIYVDNFKALNQFQMNLDQFTVIVGNNMSGKSTVLQVLDFISNLVKDDIGVVLERRGWKVSDIKSQFQKSQKITIRCDMELYVEAKLVPICWEIQMLAYAEKNIIELAHEAVYLNKGTFLLSYSSSKDQSNYIQNGIGGKIMALPKLQMNASLLKMMDFSEYPVLQALKDFWQNSDSFELLSPEKMRLSSRGEADTIGSAGEKLPAFIKSMDQAQKKRFSEKIRTVLENRIVKVDARTKGEPEWTQLIAEEQYHNKSVFIESKI